MRKKEIEELQEAFRKTYNSFVKQYSEMGTKLSELTKKADEFSLFLDKSNHIISIKTPENDILTTDEAIKLILKKLDNIERFYLKTPD